MIRSWSNPHLLYLQDIGKQAEEINKQTEEIPTYLSSLLWMFISSYHHHVKISSQTIIKSSLLRTCRLYYGCWEGFSAEVALAPAHISIITMMIMIIDHNHDNDDGGCDNDKMTKNTL